MPLLVYHTPWCHALADERGDLGRDSGRAAHSHHQLSGGIWGGTCQSTHTATSLQIMQQANGGPHLVLRTAQWHPLQSRQILPPEVAALRKIAVSVAGHPLPSRRCLAASPPPRRRAAIRAIVSLILPHRSRHAAAV